MTIEAVQKMMERNVLLWARSEEGKTALWREMSMDRISETYFSDPAKGRNSPAMKALEKFAEDGVIDLGKNGKLTLGDGFDAAFAARTPERLVLTPEDLGAMVGKRGYRAFSVLDAADKNPPLAAAIAELMVQQAEGRLEKTGFPKDRIQHADFWDEFVETGELMWRTAQSLQLAIEGTLWDVPCCETGKVREENLPEIAEILNRAIAQGFDYDPEMVPMVGRTPDRATGNELTPNIQNWRLRFFECEAENNYEPKLLEAGQTTPEVVHFILKTGGDLVIFNGRCNEEEITSAVYDAHVDQIGLPFDFNAHAGSFTFAQETLRQTGVLALSLGDVFPRPVFDKETDRILFVEHGEIVSAEELAEIDEDDEDADCFFVPDPRYNYTDMSGFEFMRMSTFDHLKALLMKQKGLSPEDATAVIEKSASGDWPRSLRCQDVPDEMHVYIPYGYDVAAFENACEASGLKEKLDATSMAVILSPEPITWAPGTKVIELDAEAPELETGSPTLSG